MNEFTLKKMLTTKKIKYRKFGTREKNIGNWQDALYLLWYNNTAMFHGVPASRFTFKR